MILSPRQQALNDEIVRLSELCKLDSWVSLIETVQTPVEVYAALQTGRPELIATARPRELTVDECAALYKLIGVLIATNHALQQHTEQVAQLVDNWMAQFTGMQGVAKQIAHFANFRKIGDDAED